MGIGVVSRISQALDECEESEAKKKILNKFNAIMTTVDERIKNNLQMSEDYKRLRGMADELIH